MEQYYYTEFLAAYLRGQDPALGALPANWHELALANGWPIHRFKRTQELPRVNAVLGMLQSFAPGHLLDIGSGRGVFLWPLLDAFPWLTVTSIDQLPGRVADLEAVAHGGIDRLLPGLGDATKLDFPADSFDGVTILEVLEHLENPALAAQEVLRVAKKFVIASVPSKPDDNPEHLRLYTQATLEELFETAASAQGCAIRTKTEYVLNHLIMLVLKT